ncbi:hypothetical protein Tco_1468642 [Tanacetum coccineum]
MDPSDALLMGDDVISTTPARENDKFIKSSVDDLVPIPKEFEATLVSTELECSLPMDTPPSPRIDVLGGENFDVDSHLGEHLVNLLMKDKKIDLPRKMVAYSPKVVRYRLFYPNLTLSDGCDHEPRRFHLIEKTFMIDVVAFHHHHHSVSDRLSHQRSSQF